jgi:hypothetical protein
MSKQVKVILAVVLLVAAAALIGYNLFGGGGPDPTKVRPPETPDANANTHVGGTRMAPGAKPNN